jgi:hypothetical protein
MYILVGLQKVFRNRRSLLLIFFIVMLFCNNVFSQVITTFNAVADIEFSMAGKNSHYYYNEIDKDHVDPRIGIAQLNFINKIKFNKQWSLTTRLLLERDKGQKLERFVVPLLNLAWLSKNRKFGITLGSFTNPFGSFSKKQLSVDRNFIGRPLAYSYHVNISDKIGFVDGMGDIAKIPIDNTVQWGTTNIYYGAYTTGALFSWNIKPAKVNWKLALVNGASNVQKRFTDPMHFGVISRLKIQPTYFWEQGFSFSHGTFLLESEISDQLDDLKDFSQTIIGTDYKLGFGFFEFSGEAMLVYYKVPQFNDDNQQFETEDGNMAYDLSNFTAYLDVKYEAPILQGSYIAYRIDHLRFNNSDQNQSWDNKVLRHSVAIGYHIHKNILARVAVSTQQIDNKEWDKTQGTLRVVLTAHF